MKKYIYVAKMSIQTMLAYRAEFWTYTIADCFMMIAVGFFWKAVYGDSGTSYDVTGSDMTTYTIISIMMMSLYYMGVEDRLTDSIKTGSIATDMIKPVNLFSMYFAEDIGNIITKFFISGIPIFVVGSLILGVPTPASGEHLAVFLLSFVLGYGINWTFSAIFAMIAFYAINLGPAFSVKYHFVNLLSGGIIPIWFFPQWLQGIVKCLPFVYMYQTPLSIYIGKYEISECMRMVGVQAIWFVALTVAFIYAQNRATRRVLVQGG